MAFARFRLLLLALAGLALLAWAGRAPAAPLQNLRFQHLSVEQGLPQESVLATAQDRQGFIWMGTQNGLVRYDGYRFVVYKNDPADPRSLASNVIQALLLDGEGELWIATLGGLHRYDRPSNSFDRHVPPKPGLRDATGLELRNLRADGHDALWLGSSDGLQRFDKRSGQFQFWHHDAARPGSLASDRIRGLALDAQGRLWVGTGAGLDRLDRGATSFVHHRMDSEDQPDTAHNTVQTLMVDRQNRLWVATYAGLEAWDLNTPAQPRQRFTPEQGIPRGRYFALLQDAEDQIWVGAIADGLKRWSPQTQRFVQHKHQFDDPHSLSDDQVASLFQDRTGTLWVGTWDAGMNLVDISSGGFERVLPALDPRRSKIERVMHAVASDGHGGLWLAGLGGLKHLDLATDQITEHGTASPPLGLSDRRIHALLRAPDGRLLLGTETGLEIFDPATGRFSTRRVPAQNATTNNVQHLLLDTAGVLWVASAGGLHRMALDGTAVTTYLHDTADPSSLSHNHVQALIEDPQGQLWAGTDSGLNRLDRATGRVTRFQHEPDKPLSLGDDRISSLLQDALGRLWIGTYQGLSEMRVGANGQPEFHNHGRAQGLASERVMAIAADEGGALWLSTDAGLSRYAPEAGTFRNYTAQEGMIEGSYSPNAAFRDAEGRLYFGGVRGITRFLPLQVRNNLLPPQLTLTELKIFNQPVRPGHLPEGVALDGPIDAAQRLTLSHQNSVFTLEFAALHFADASRNRYAYMLEGFDHGWVETGADQRSATYTNLNPGDYVFRVKAANKDGIWTPHDTTLAITITPPVWRTWWARALALLLLAGSIYTAHRVRLRVLTQQTQRLEEQVHTRTAELLLQKQVVEQTHHNISVLSDIGREITASLQLQEISATLYRHVNELMDASVFALGIYRPERGTIDYDFCVERGRRFAPYSRPMSDPDQLAVWCVAHRREIWINDVAQDFRQYIGALPEESLARHGIRLEDGSEPGQQRSMLYLPLIANGQVLGVISVHSFEPRAYTQVHLDMLRTLAAYAAVALENAQAYQRLQSAQAQLVAQEKLAALGALVAGVAHELNTPIGNSLLAASTLHENTSAFTRQLEEGALKRSELNRYCGMADEASIIIMRSLESAAELVSSFKQVAVDQSSAHRRRFALQRVCNELLSTLMSRINKAGHRISVDIPPGILLDSYPGPLGQVLANLVNNAMLHGFEGREGGQMRLTASQPLPGRVLLRFEDDGRGITPEHLGHVFEPFFTTKFGQGGSGLGLHVSYNIVTSLLGGQIEVQSTPGRGTAFILDMPLDFSGKDTPPGPG